MAGNTVQNVVEEKTINERLQFLIATLQDSFVGYGEYLPSSNLDCQYLQELKSVLEDNTIYKSFIDDFVLEGIVSKMEEILMNRNIVLSSKYQIYSIEELCEECARIAKVIQILIHYQKIQIQTNDGCIVESKELSYNILDSGAVFLGRNGCGKTTLAKETAKIARACLIKANRVFDIEEVVPIQKTHIDLLEDKKIKVLSEYMGSNGVIVFSNHKSNSELMQILSELLINRRIKREKYLNALLKSENTLSNISNADVKSEIDIIIDLWNSVFKNDNVQLYLTDNYELMLRKDSMQNKGYNIIEMSDGEKDVLYIITMIVYSRIIQKKRIIVVDEPEKHLHKTLLIDLWNLMERNFSDCKFIYFSHNLNFIESRHLPKFWLKKLDHNTFDIEIEKLGDDIPQTLYPLFGLNKKVIFCEGEEDSYDYKVYQTLFPSWQVVCCGSCAQVRNITTTYHIKWPNDLCIGIIDKDYRDENEINLLKGQGIYVLDVAEIENLFLQKEFIEKYANAIGFDGITSVEEIKVRIAIWLKKFIDKQADNYVCFKTNKLLNHNVEGTSNTDKFLLLKNKINAIKAIDLTAEKEQFKQRMLDLTRNIVVANLEKPTDSEIKNCIVSDDDYAEIIKNLNEKSALVAVQQALDIKKDYIGKAYNVMKRNVEFQDILVKGLPIELQRIYQEGKKLKK